MRGLLARGHRPEPFFGFYAKDGETLSKPGVGYVGIFHHYYRHPRGKATYFADVPAATAARDEVFAASFDPIARMLERLVPLATGDVILFNTRNPHEIAEGQGGADEPRISLGTFVGRLPEGDLLLWS